jgi:hypothetical protein
MPLITCPDCGTEMSDAAPACPKCARPAIRKTPESSHRTRNGCLAVGALIVVIILIGQAGDANRAAHPGSVARRDAPGIARVGKIRVENDWKAIDSVPGLHSWACSGENCVVMFDPALWSQMPFDLKRDVTAALGIDLAFGKQANWTELHDMYTNAELSHYNADLDKTTVPSH